MKPTRIFLSVKTVPYRLPAGIDPFTYREKRPLRFRASWWTRGTGMSEPYRSKVVASKEEAVRLARKWLAQQNKETVRWIDTTDHPSGYAPTPPITSTDKKSAAQLDSEIAESLAKENQ
jgi:hypothetical protein